MYVKLWLPICWVQYGGVHSVHDLVLWSNCEDSWNLALLFYICFVRVLKLHSEVVNYHHHYQLLINTL